MHCVRLVDASQLSAKWAMVHHNGKWILFLNREHDTPANRAEAWTWAANAEATSRAA